MPRRRLPVRPSLEQLRHQAKDLLRQLRSGDPEAAADFLQFHSGEIKPTEARLADAQQVLARSYEAASWPRLVQACQLTDAIWGNDADAVRELILKHPHLLHEQAIIRQNSNWGPPMSYAANLGRDAIIEMLHAMGARDHVQALDRAALQGQVATARRLHAMMASPPLAESALDSPAYTLSVAGTALLFELGAKVYAADGRLLAPVAMVLETDSRNPEAKHEILRLYVEHGVILPDTAPMALHRGRIDLLKEHLMRDPGLLRRQFRWEEIYPPEFGCHDELHATHGTPLKGTTLLHMAVDYAEMDIVRWLLDHGADVNAKAAVDADGFGGHTALFATVVSQPNFWTNRRQGVFPDPAVAPFTKILLAHEADVNVRASLRKQLHPGYGDEPMREYRDVTALSWGQRFTRKEFVSEAAMQLIAEAGGGV